jgi:hypothetical protein
MLLLARGATLDHGPGDNPGRAYTSSVAAVDAAGRPWLRRDDGTGSRPRSGSGSHGSGGGGSVGSGSRPRGRSFSDSGSRAARAEGGGCPLDGDGLTPLGVLQAGAAPALLAATRRGDGGDVFSFGSEAADFQLGYGHSGGSGRVPRPRRVLGLAHREVRRLQVAKSIYHNNNNNNNNNNKVPSGYLVAPLLACCQWFAGSQDHAMPSLLTSRFF